MVCDREALCTAELGHDLIACVGSSFLVSTPSTTANTVQWVFDSATATPGLWEVSVWSPQSTGFCTHVSVTINAADGSNAATVNQNLNGGRWVYLGDYYVSEQSGLSVTLSDAGCGSAAVTANALRVARWPECEGVVGRSCEQRDWWEKITSGGRV